MGSPLRAVLCYLDMLSCGDMGANNYTFPPLIKACTVGGVSFKFIGRVVHAHVLKFGFWDDLFVVSALIEFYCAVFDMETARMLFDKAPVKDVVMWTAMIDGYGKVGAAEAARMLFDEMPERNVISWSALIAAYSRVSDFKEVLNLFRQLQEAGIEPNESILVSVLTACAHLGAVTQGLWVHSYAKQRNFIQNTILATALVDMYSKCGYVESALRVFEDIPVKDAGAWNAMISGVAMNGDAKKSIDLFNKMVLSGTQPTETTFVAVLTACTHARMVEEGLELFDKMSAVFRVKPQLEHQACVVDLLARAGRLEEAERFIEEEMGGLGEGDANVWGALLGACRVYGNVEIGDRVWRKLVNMGVGDSGTHVLTYNIYKEAGREGEASRVRKFISEAGIKKKPGCSVIEVDGVAEEFLAGDFGHPQSKEIRNLIDSLSQMVKLKEV